jgi:hypothetical protein
MAALKRIVVRTWVPAAALWLLAPGAAFGASINVTASMAEGVSNDGKCSLREAVSSANNNSPAPVSPGECAKGDSGFLDTISVPAGTYTLAGAAGDDSNASGDLDISLSGTAGEVLLQGAGAGSTTINANDADRVIDLTGSAVVTNVVTIADLTITGGKLTGGFDGAGINAGGGGNHDVVLDGVRVASNEAEGAGGGVWIQTTDGSVEVKDSTISGNSTASAGGGVYVADFSGASNPGTDLLLQNSTVSGNHTTSSATGVAGAGVYLANRVQATLSGTTVSNNDNVSTDGGGITLNSNYSDTSLTVQSGSRITGNSVKDLTSGTGPRGGGIFVLASASSSGPQVTIQLSEISGNTAKNGTQGSGGGIEFQGGTGGKLTLDRSTVSGNSAGFSGGGVRNASSGSTLESTNSTVAGNDSIGAPNAPTPNPGQGGGIWAFGSLKLRHTTIAANRSGEGDAVYLFGASGTQMQSTGSIFANDAADGSTTDACRAVAGSGGDYNIDDGTSCGLGGTGNLTNTNAKLGSLAPHGAFNTPLLPTIDLLAGSPAVDLVPSLTSCKDLNGQDLIVDERGFPRAFDDPLAPGDGCDAGAYELNKTCLGRGITTFFGSSASETFVGTTGPDVVDLGAGNDVARPVGGDDVVCAGTGIDTILFGSKVRASTHGASGEGSDLFSGIENLTGSKFKDTLVGDSLKNLIKGGKGNDTLKGKGGKDTLVGGAGEDACKGGAGNDIGRSCESESSVP